MSVPVARMPIVRRPCIRLPNEFDPRDYQLPFVRYFTDGGSDGAGKRAAWCMHRRAGKDLTALHTTCMLMHRRRGVYWHVFPTAEQGRKSIWTEFTADGKRIMESVFPAAIRKTPKEWSPQAEMVVELKCGSIWRLMGSDKIEVVGAGPVGVVFSEFALAKPSTWDLVSPMLRANGGWAAFISTPRGPNRFKQLFDAAKPGSGWFRDLKTVHDTGQRYASTRRPGEWVGPDEMMEEELAEGRPPAWVRQEYLCDWTAANVGSVWGDMLEALEKRGGLGAFDHPSNGVFLNLDLGFADSTSLNWWRPRGQGVEWIDSHEAHGKPLSYYFDLIDSRPYKLAKIWLPHDARAKTLATGSSILDRFIEHYGADKIAIVPQLSLLDGIQAMRWLLQQPETRIHERCVEMVDAWRQYHYEYDVDRKTYASKPEHDWSSHYADSGRYSAVVVRYSEQMTRKPSASEAHIPSAPEPVTFNDLRTQTLRRLSGRQ